MNQAYAEKFGVALVLEPVPGDIEVLADPDRLMQVLTNLLSNGAKFSTSGTAASLHAVAAGKTVRFEVQDHGIGIPEDFRSRIFEKFAQAEAAATDVLPARVWVWRSPRRWWNKCAAASDLTAASESARRSTSSCRASAARRSRRRRREPVKVRSVQHPTTDAAMVQTMARRMDIIGMISLMVAANQWL
jgi:Histidine kinase-, DNA gyrase B-, and HSP90-like ATPase